MKHRRSLRVLVAFAATGLLVAGNGCPATRNKSLPPGVWGIERLSEERGHDTLVDDEGHLYHNYFFAVVLERGTKRLGLLYENQLPSSFAFQVNDRVRIAGLETADFDDNFGGYWLHDLQLRSTSDNDSISGTSDD